MERRKLLAQAEAERIRITAVADAERMKNEGIVLKQNPLLINKIIAERLSDKLQIMMVPADGKFFFTNDVMRGMNTANHVSQATFYAWRKRLAARARSTARTAPAFAAVREAAALETNLVPVILEAVKASATLGEIAGAMREIFGAYRARSEI